jgi:hypothetical protein
VTGQADFTTEYSLNDHLKSPRVPPSRPVPLALLGSILIVPLVLSVEHFERFGAERLMPVLNEM